MATIEELHREWMKDPAYRQAHKDLAAEYERARAAIQVREQAHSTTPDPRKPTLHGRGRSRLS